MTTSEYKDCGLAQNVGANRITIPYKNTVVPQNLLRCKSLDAQRTTTISKLRDFFFEFEGGSLQCVVNQMFISYPMKDGMCRLINQNGVDKYKICNSSSKRFLDLSLSYADDNLLATLDQNGIVSLWRVEQTSGAYLVDFHMPPHETVRRVILDRTQGSEFMLTVHDNHVRVWHIKSVKKLLAEPSQCKVRDAPGHGGRKTPIMSIECDDDFFDLVTAKWEIPSFQTMCWGVDQRSMVVGCSEGLQILNLEEPSGDDIGAPTITVRLPLQPMSNISSLNILEGFHDESKVLVIGKDDDTTFEFHKYENGLEVLQTIMFRTASGDSMKAGLVSVNRERPEERDVLVVAQEQFMDAAAIQEQVDASADASEGKIPMPMQTILCMRLSAYKQENWTPIHSVLKIPCPDSSMTLQTVTGMPSTQSEGQSMFFFLSHNRLQSTRGSVIYCQSVNHNVINSYDMEDYPLETTPQVEEELVESQRQGLALEEVRMEEEEPEHEEMPSAMQSPTRLRTPPPGLEAEVTPTGDEASNEVANGTDAAEVTEFTPELTKDLLRQLGKVVSQELEKSKGESTDKINGIVQNAFEETDHMLSRQLAQAMTMVDDGATNGNAKERDANWSFEAYVHQVMKYARQSVEEGTQRAMEELAPQLERELHKTAEDMANMILSELTDKHLAPSVGLTQPKSIAKPPMEAPRPSAQFIQETIHKVIPDVLERTISQNVQAQIRTLFDANVVPILEKAIASQEMARRRHEESMEVLKREVIGPLAAEVAHLQRAVEMMQRNMNNMDSPPKKQDMSPNQPSPHKMFTLFYADRVQDAFLMAIKAQASGDNQDLLTQLCCKITDIDKWLQSAKLTHEVQLFLALALIREITDNPNLVETVIANKLHWVQELIMASTMQRNAPWKSNTRGILQQIIEGIRLFKSSPKGKFLSDKDSNLLLHLITTFEASRA